VTVKKETNYFIFEEEIAEKFLEYYNSAGKDVKDNTLEICINSQVKHPRHQLSLKLEGLPSSRRGDVTTFPWQCHQVTFLRCRTLGLKDCSFLCQVPYLILSGCSEISDISPFQNCLSVDLSYSGCVVNNSNVHLLAKVRSLRLDFCLYVSDVSCLSKVSNLSLCYCSAVRDVSMLGNVKKLNISSCPRIMDISTLGSVRYLNIVGLKRIKKGLSSTRTIKELTVSESTVTQLKAIKDPSFTVIILHNDLSTEAVKKSKLSRFYNLHFSAVETVPHPITLFPSLRSLSVTSSLFVGTGCNASYYISSLRWLVQLEIAAIYTSVINIDFTTLPLLQEVRLENSTFQDLHFCGRSLRTVILREIIIKNQKIDISCAMKRFHLYFERTKVTVGKKRMPITLIGKGNEIESFYCNIPQKILVESVEE
jgi:hypothetical protein